MKMGRKRLGLHAFVLLAAALGLVCGMWPITGQMVAAQTITKLFMNSLKLVSLPIIFLSVASTICGMETVSELKWLGRRVASYTLATTVCAATLALGLFVWIRPAGPMPSLDQATQAAGNMNYWEHLINVIPSNFFQPFMEGNVLGVLILAVMFGCALLTVPERGTSQAVMTSTLAALMRIIRVICLVIPAVVWAGVVQSFGELKDGGVAAQLMRYLACVVAANLLQAAVVLPLFLKARGIAPWRALAGFWPALGVAFFSKSSVATLPIAMRCAENNLGVSPRVSRFTFPICTTINMNGCAAFILITVLFVSQSHGHVYAPWEQILWVLIATLAAVGNAGVPMGCYFLASAFLAAMNVPLTLMALILPFYSFLDMLETAVNVWSDGCVALLVESHQEIALAAPVEQSLAA
jgi:Na+/H+-dicarboxylate symporter